MRRFLHVLRDDWPRLAIELFVLVAGITISFALDEWRSGREDRRLERRAWESIQEDLGADSAYLSKRIAQLATFTRAYDGLLAGGPADSLDTYMDRAISYVVFTPRLGAYHELQQMSGSRLIRNRALLGQLTDSYNREYVVAAEWDGINRDFVLERMIPYVDMTAPYMDGVMTGDSVAGMNRVYHALAGRDQFRNLLRTNRLFKESQRATYGAALARIVALRKSIARELAASGA